MIAQLVVELALRPLELAEHRLLGLRRQLRRDLLLGAPQQERAQRHRQPLAGLRRELACRTAHGAEVRQAPEEPRIQELEQAPELAQVVLDRRAGRDQPMPRPHAAHGARAGRVRVLDRLRFVEDAVVELDRRESIDVALERAVRGEHDVELREGRRVAAAFGAVELEDREPRGEAGRLFAPVVEQGTRHDDERRHPGRDGAISPPSQARPPRQPDPRPAGSGALAGRRAGRESARSCRAPCRRRGSRRSRSVRGTAASRDLHADSRGARRGIPWADRRARCRRRRRARGASARRAGRPPPRPARRPAARRRRTSPAAARGARSHPRPRPHPP